MVVRMGNRAEFPVALFAAIAADLVAVPTSAALTAGEAEWIIADSGAAAVIADPALPVDPGAAQLVGPGQLAQWRSPRSAQPEHAVGDPDRPALLTYTSGTSGRPKGVLHAHRSAWGRRPMVPGWTGLGEGDVMLHAGALNWTYTLGVGLMDPWACAASAVVYDGPKDPQVWPALIEAAAATHFAAVPGVYRALLRDGAPDTWRLESLRAALTAGEALPPPLLARWQEATGVPLREALGMSEISTFVSAGPHTPPRPGSAGRAQPGRRIAVLDDRGQPAPPDEIGRLAIDRTDPGLMLGYWQARAQQARPETGEWFVTGDLASLDTDGYLRHHGRGDDLINAMGYRVSPVEVEEGLATAPGVREVAVAGTHAAEGVTLVTAFVVPADPAVGVDEDAVLAHAAARLAAYKCPRRVVIVDSLPRTANGKVQRRELGDG